MPHFSLFSHFPSLPRVTLSGATKSLRALLQADIPKSSSELRLFTVVLQCFITENIRKARDVQQVYHFEQTITL